MQYQLRDIEQSYSCENGGLIWSREEALITLDELGDRASELLDEISELAGETKRLCGEIEDMREKLNGLKEIF